MPAVECAVSLKEISFLVLKFQALCPLSRNAVKKMGGAGSRSKGKLRGAFLHLRQPAVVIAEQPVKIFQARQ